MNREHLDLLQAFAAHDVRFLIVGGYALGFHGHPRLSIDLDLWVEPSPENAVRVVDALKDFGAPVDAISAADFAQPAIVYQIGVVPNQVDIITKLTGLEFDEAWEGRVPGEFGECTVPFVGNAAFIKNKRARGRPQDLVDIHAIDG